MFLRGEKSLTQRRAQYYNVVDTNTDGGRGAVIRQVWFLEGFTMSIQNEYLSGLMERVVRRNPAEPEFHQGGPGGSDLPGPGGGGEAGVYQRGRHGLPGRAGADHQVPGALGG